MERNLREQLMGAWKLVSCVSKPLDGSAPLYPLGEEPMGIILYTQDGYMSAQLMGPDRPRFASSDWLEVTDAEWDAAASLYLAYSGEFQVDDEKQTVAHSVYVSLSPNWLGLTQTRLVDIQGDDLFLSTAAPMQYGGRLVHTYLHWKRAV